MVTDDENDLSALNENEHLIDGVVKLLEDESCSKSDVETARIDSKTQKRGLTMTDMFPSSSSKLPKFKKVKKDKSKKKKQVEKIPGQPTARRCLVSKCYYMK